MAERSRTTKKLAQRIDLNYFKRLYPIPKWRRILTLVLIGLGIAWLLVGRQQTFNAGPLARSHAILTSKCVACHVAESGFSRRVTDQACLSCHDGPMHHDRQTFTPACRDCHVEHQGSFLLASTRDKACTQCHAALKTTDGRMLYAANIDGFEENHPEFAALREKDPGTIKFGHQVHMKKDLRSPRGPVQMKCVDCHVRQQASIAPIDYQKHCAECHPLSFDSRFAEPAPHMKPEIVIDFVTAKFKEYIARHPEEVRMVDVPRTLQTPLAPAANATEWLSRRVVETKQLLWRKTCRECHTLGFKDAVSLPDVPLAAITSRWMKHALFDHKGHQMIACTECHDRALTSRDTADVLLPGIQTCRSCHHSGPEAAGANCSECHAYHDWSKEKKIDGKYRIDLNRGTQ